MFVDSNVAVHLFVVWVIALAVVVRELLGSFGLPSRKPGEIYFFISPSARVWPQFFLLGMTKLPNNSRTTTARAMTHTTKRCTATFESTNMQYLAFAGKHSKSYRQRSISPSLVEHGQYFTPQKSNKATCCNKKIALDSSYNLSYSALMALQGVLRKLTESGSWTLKNFLFLTPRSISYATEV